MTEPMRAKMGLRLRAGEMQRMQSWTKENQRRRERERKRKGRVKRQKKGVNTRSKRLEKSASFLPNDNDEEKTSQPKNPDAQTSARGLSTRMARKKDSLVQRE